MWDRMAGIRIRHIPTGAEITARDRSLHRARLIGLGLIRAVVAHPPEHPEPLVRTYDLLAGKVRDVRTGREADADAILDRGELERVRDAKV